jgi:hypothetical protein
MLGTTNGGFLVDEYTKKFVWNFLINDERIIFSILAETVLPKLPANIELTIFLSSSELTNIDETNSNDETDDQKKKKTKKKPKKETPKQFRKRILNPAIFVLDNLENILNDIFLSAPLDIRCIALRVNRVLIFLRNVFIKCNSIQGNAHFK